VSSRTSRYCSACDRHSARVDGWVSNDGDIGRELFQVGAPLGVSIVAAEEKVFTGVRHRIGSGAQDLNARVGDASVGRGVLLVASYTARRCNSAWCPLLRCTGAGSF